MDADELLRRVNSDPSFTRALMQRLGFMMDANEHMVEDEYLKSNGHLEISFECLPDA